MTARTDRSTIVLEYAKHRNVKKANSSARRRVEATRGADSWRDNTEQARTQTWQAQQCKLHADVHLLANRAAEPGSIKAVREGSGDEWPHRKHAPGLAVETAVEWISPPKRRNSWTAGIRNLEPRGYEFGTATLDETGHDVQCDGRGGGNK